MTIEVGIGVTEGVGSDRYPYTVVEVRRNGRELVIQRDEFRRTDQNGLSESQEYEYTPNPEGSKVTITLRHDGRYRRKGEDRGLFTIGHREAYQDPSF